MKYVLAMLLVVGCGGDTPTASCAGAGYLGSWTAQGTGAVLVLADDCKLETGQPSACRLKGEHSPVGGSGVTLSFYVMDLETCTASTAIADTQECTYSVDLKTSPATMDLSCGSTITHYHQ